MSTRTRGLHQGTANHKPDCQCPPCKGKRARSLGQIKALAAPPMPLMATDATIAAIELSQNTEALRLTAELAKVQGEARVLQNALNESRKISQEREKQLAEANQKLSHFMGRTSAAEAYLDTVKAALDCKDPGQLAERAQKLQGDLKDAELQISTARLETTEAKGILSSHFARAERLETELAYEKTLCGTYKAEWMRLTGLLSQISGKLSDCCEWDELPLAVETLLQRCNQYGDRSDAMGQANTQLQQERDAVVSELREAHAALKLANASIGSLERDKDLLKEGLAAAEKRGELATTHALFEGNLKTIVASVLLSVIFYMIGKWGKL